VIFIDKSALKPNMKPTLLFISFCSLTLFANAQFSKTTSPDAGLSTLRKLTIRLNDPHDPIPPPSPDAFRPFSHFEVIDERPDTTRIGVHGNLPMNSHEFDRQLTFPGPAAQELTHYLNRYFVHPDAPDTVLVVLRQLWLSDTDPYFPSADPYRPASQGQPAEKTHIRLKAEVYARRDNRYLPLVRIDTLQATGNVTYSTVKCTYNGWEKELVAILEELTENAALAVARKESSGKWITWDDIHQFNRSRFTIPIFDNPTLSRGVYASFEEFRDNAPSIHDFEIRKDNGGLAIYLKGDDGTSYYTHNAWGCCDGRQIFLIRDGLLKPLRKAGNSFCFYGIEPDDVAPAPGTFGGHNERHCLYVIDMDTGEVY
jgi:hypothetical protein